MMRVGILTVQLPFRHNGAERHARDLCGALRDAGVEAEIISIPFRESPPDAMAAQILACRLVDIVESCGVRIDRVIGLEFPAYLMAHPHKVLWLRHLAPCLDEEGGRPGEPEAARLVEHADRASLRQARRIFTQSQHVSNRLRDVSGAASVPLYPPLPDAGHYAWREAGDFLFVPGHGAPMRQALVLKALAVTRHPVKLAFAGAPGAADGDAGEMRRLGEALDGRVRWLGEAAAAEERILYGDCLGIVVTAEDAVHGDVALAAMLSSKPVIACTDAGGPLDFVIDGQTGAICAPEIPALAEAMDRLWEDRAKAREWGRAGRARYDALGLSWRHVVESVLV
jgi:glycosyltransferase involved in cell wall biosynthesis